MHETQFESKEQEWMLEGRPTLVLGASSNPARTSFTAINMLRKAGHSVFAVGGRKGEVADVQISRGIEGLRLPRIHTVTMYMNAGRQAQYHDFILELAPDRIIFNPGAENADLMRAAEAQGIACLDACTLVLITHQSF